MSMQITSAPKTFKGKLKIIGPGFVWAAAAIGSGELIISAKVGSEYGFLFLWALWIGIWFKYWIQKGILDLTILTGRPVIELWDKLRFGKLFSLYWLLFFILTATGVAGLLGLTASIGNAIFPFLSTNIWAVLIVAVVIAVAYYHKYKGFEKIMLVLGLILGAGTLATIFLVQPDLSNIFVWGVPTTTAAGLVFLSLLGWGAGSGPDLMLPYSWWVAEKGYQNLSLNSGSNKKSLMENKDDNSVKEVKSWLKVAKYDTIAGYIAAGLVASIFMIAGAVILQPRGIVVEGLDVLKNMSVIFTGSYGSWTFLLFMIPALAAIFSTTLGVFDGGRIALAHLARMFSKKEMLPIENIRGNSWYRVTLVLFSVVPLILFLGIQRPVFLVIIAGVISAISMPLLGGLVFWSLLKQVPKEYRPNKFYLANLIIGVLVYLYFMIQSFIKLT